MATSFVCGNLYHLVVLVAAIPFVSTWWFGAEDSSELCSATGKLRCQCPEDLISLSRQGVDCSFRNITGQIPQSLVLPSGTGRLDFTNNQITNLVKSQFDGSGASTLQELILTRNNISHIDSEAFRKLSRLKIVDLSRNNISILPVDLFKDLNNFQQLDLSFNALLEISDRQFSFVPYLQQLKLNFIPIGDVLRVKDGVFSNLSNLRVLELQNVTLFDVPVSLFRNLTSLQVLVLSDNPLSRIPTVALAQVGITLEKLDLSGITVIYLPSNCFDGLIQLRTLLLNRLYFLEDIHDYAFERLGSLEFVSLEHNIILTNIHDKAFGEACNPSRVSFYQSGLHSLDSKLLVWDQLEELNLQGNPWNCDCELAWLKQINMSEDLRSDIRCYAPPELRNEALYEIDDEKFVCYNNIVHAAIMIVLDLLVIVAVVSSSIFLFLYLWRKYRLKCCKKPVSTDNYFKMSTTATKVELEWDNRDLS